MKKIYGILMLAMLAMCSVALVSCSDDDEDAIIGTWNVVDGDEAEDVTFQKNYSYIHIYYDLINGRWEDVETEYGTWSIDGNKLTMIDSEDPTPLVFTFKIDGKKLTLTYGNRSVTLNKK